MKKFCVNVLATTAISLILLSFIALSFHATVIFLYTIFQVLGANIVVHLSLILLNKLETKNAIIEMLLQIVLITAILLIYGWAFQWFSSTPVWVLVPMGVAIYAVSTILNLLCMKQEAQEINALIKKRNDKGKQQL